MPQLGNNGSSPEKQLQNEPDQVEQENHPEFEGECEPGDSGESNGLENMCGLNEYCTVMSTTTERFFSFVHFRHWTNKYAQISESFRNCSEPVPEAKREHGDLETPTP